MAAASTGSMRAIVLDAPGPAEALTIRRLPVPRPAEGWVLIAVRAFGLNRSELHTRLGLAEGVVFRVCSASKPPAWLRNARAESSRSANR
jgi:NADPH:quinone reductase-like Zn-dependent oxidoreductase